MILVLSRTGAMLTNIRVLTRFPDKLSLLLEKFTYIYDEVMELHSLLCLFDYKFSFPLYLGTDLFSHF